MSTADEASGSKLEISPKKRKIITVACNHCRSRKSRCDGQRPTCRRCSDKGLACAYAAKENESRVGALKRDIQLLRDQLASFENASQVSSDHRVSVSATSLGVGSSSMMSPIAISPTAISPEALVSAAHRERLPSSSLVGGSAVPASSQEDSTYTVCMTLIRAMINRSDDEATLILAKLRVLTSWSQIASELSDTSGGVASFIPEGGPHEEVTAAMLVDGLELERESSFGTWYNTLSSTAWLPIMFDRNVWKSTGLAGKFAPGAYRDHISVTKSGLDDVSKEISAESLPDPSTGRSMASPSRQRHVNIPVWALRSFTDPSLVEEPLEAILQSLRAEIDDGAPAEMLCGSHAYVAALYDEKAFRSAPKLSQVAASIVKSVKLEPFPLTLTVIGMMWLYWSLLRWTLMPSKDTYDELPEILRPTPSQLFVRHPFVVDFVLSPDMREHLCTAGIFELSWISPAFEAMVYESSGTLAEAVEPNPKTGDLDLAIEIKEQMGKPEAWSIEPSAEAVLPDIGRFFKIRSNN